MKALIFEEHSSVLAHWWDAQLRGRTIVYLDAHLDLQHVNPERVRRLAQCRSAAQVAALEKPHDLWPDPDFSYSLENFLYPAARLGLVGRLIWVAPPHVKTGYSDRVVRELQQMDGVRPDELASFRRVDGRIEGRLLGLDVTLCDVGQLERLAVPPDSLIDIDVDYFVEVPGDHPWVDPREVFDALQRLSLASDWVTISRSVSSGFTPLRHRFFADYLAALWEERAEDADHYARLFELDRLVGSGERAAAARGLSAETARRPECAATWHLLGLAQADPSEAARSHSRAAALSGAYAPSVLRAACEIRHRRLATDLAGVLGLGRRLAGVAPAEQGPAFAALGLLFCAFGDRGRAIECYRRAEGLLGRTGELALEIGKLLVQAGRGEEASGYLAAALDDDKARSAARAYLGVALLQRGELEQARAHLQQAHEAAPCWEEPLQMLARVHRELGEHARAREDATRWAELRAQRQALHARLTGGA